MIGHRPQNIPEWGAESTLGLQQAMKNKQQQGLKHSLEEQATPQRANWGCNTPDWGHITSSNTGSTLGQQSLKSKQQH